MANLPRITGWLSLLQLLLSTIVFILSFACDVALGYTSGSGLATAATLGIAAGFESEGVRESLILHAILSFVFLIVAFIPAGQLAAIPNLSPMQKATVAMSFLLAFESIAATAVSALAAYRMTKQANDPSAKPLLAGP